MALYRVQIAIEAGNDLAIDDSTNTFYLQDIGPTSDPGNLAQSAANLWATFRDYPVGTTRITAKIYDMEQAEPRVPLETKYGVGLVANSPGGPREVALCLSFYSTTNIPRRRGRLYVGPWHSGIMAQRPEVLQAMNKCRDLAIGLTNLGGTDVDWMQYSQVNNLANKVTNWWCDNEWDTVRSRGLRGTSRISGVTDE